MAECCAWTGDFLPLIADYVWAICEESAWQLPPHNSYVRDAPQLPLPDARRPVVDLFAAETAALLAMVHYLLGRELEQYAPGIRTRIRREVEARALRPGGPGISGGWATAANRCATGPPGAPRTC